jgi:hypothetical protein
MINVINLTFILNTFFFLNLGLLISLNFIVYNDQNLSQKDLNATIFHRSYLIKRNY